MGYDYNKCRCDECKAYKQAARRKDYVARGEEIRAKNRAYHQANKERLNAARAVRGQDPQYQRRYRRANAERVNAKNRAWRAANPEKARWWDFVNGARRRNGKFTLEAVEWIKSLVDPICTYCGEPAETIDHIVPVSQGGTGDRANLTPACHACNRSKRHTSVEEFLKRRMKWKET